MLPNDSFIVEYIFKKHQIEISIDDMRSIVMFQKEIHNEWSRERLLPVICTEIIPVNVHDIPHDLVGGRVIAAVAFAAVGFFLAPVLGIGALTGALIGASIGWRLFSNDANKQNNQKKESRSQQTFGFNSAPSIAPIGGVVPLIFTNKSINPKGGIRTSGIVLHSRIDTFGGVQKLSVLYGTCLGTIGDIDQMSVLINGQPRSSFFQDEIQTSVSFGTSNQQTSSQFPCYSQCITVSSNNQLGVSERGKYTGATTSSATISVSTDDFDSFSPSDRYSHNGQEFTLVSRNASNNTLQANRILNLINGQVIVTTYRIRYETSKRCSEIHLNLVANLWARNDKNELLRHGILFALWIDGINIGRFLLASKSESDIRNKIIIRNLNFTKHEIELHPVNGAIAQSPIYRLSDNRLVTRLDTQFIVNNKRIQLEFEQNPTYTQTESEANSLISLGGNKKQLSNDRGPVLQLTTVNEIVYPGDLSHPYLYNYRGVACASIVATASNRINSDPSPSWEVTKGLQGRVHLAAGRSNAASTTTVLLDPSASFVSYGILANSLVIVRNLDQGLEAVVVSVDQTRLTTTTPLFWRQGDRYLVYQDNVSLNYFPDVYVYTLTQRNGGLGGILRGNQLADNFVDYPSVVRSRRFCIANNFFWDGVIDTPVSWASWASQESISSLLFPTRIGGKFGLIPEEQTNPVAIFNASNILPDTYYEEYVPRQKLNTVHVTFTDNLSGQPRDRTVTIMTNNVRNGIDTMFAESIKIAAVTNEHQAIRVGQIYLNSRLMQDRVIGFSTALQGYALREGDLIIVQHITTEIEKECSGFVLESLSFSNGIQKLVISSPSTIGLGNNYSAAVYRLADGTIQKDLVCVGYSEGNPAKNILEIRGLSSPLNPPRENMTGDYVVVGRDSQRRRTYRVQKIEPQENGTVSITAVLWIPEILTNQNFVIS